MKFESGKVDQLNHFTYQEASVGLPVVEAQEVMNSLMDYQVWGHQNLWGWCLDQVGLARPTQNWDCWSQTV